MRKTVLVTGDSSGIGRAACQRLTAADWQVFGASRRPLDSSDWTHLIADVRDEDSVDRAVAAILAKTGRLDAVVHCAGESFVSPIEEASLAEVQRHFDLNVFGTIRVLRSVLPQMRKQRAGKIVVVGSIGGLIGLPYQGYYSAGKFALDGLVESLRPEIAPFGIDAAILHPGDIDTELGQNRVRSANTDEQSPYFEAFERAVEFFAAAEKAGSAPDLVARSIERMLNQKHMPVRVVAGKAIEKFGVVAKRLMHSRHFETLMSIAYSAGNQAKK